MTTDALPIQRIDAFPEQTDAIYLDRGCDLHAACLTCPLVRCRYDEPHIPHNSERDREIVAMHAEGRPISAIATRFGVSRRTVFRVLAEAKEEAA